MQPEHPEQPQLKLPLARRPALICTTASTWRAGALLAGCLVVLGGCQPHRDFVDTTLEWTDHMRGGAIAAQRPPPPGQYDPYPHVGLTPTTAPEMPSPNARSMLTTRLLHDRNLTYRTVAANGSLTPVIPPAPNAAPASTPKTAPPAPAQAANAPATLPEGATGAIMDAAEAPPSPTTVPQKPVTPPSKSKDKAAQAQQPEEAELAMPEISQKVLKPLVPESTLPPVPDAPPNPPEFPGFDTPSDAHLVTPPTPNYDLSTPQGTALHFLPQSDALSSGQDSTLAKIMAQTPNGPFYIRGFGSAASLSPQDQAQAVQLGLLRAQRVAKALIELHAPASAIHIRGDAYGSGAYVARSP